MKLEISTLANPEQLLSDSESDMISTMMGIAWVPWQAFVEKNGLDGAIDIVDLKNIYEALKACYEAIQQCLKVIYDITGLADIIRGQSEAQETATAQQIKGQYASLRLNNMKEDVALFATRLFQLKAQIMCGKFAPETLLKISGANKFSPEDQQIIPAAMQLLLGERATNPDAVESPNPLRIFRIEVNADTMVQIDENTEKQQRTEFLTAVGGYLSNAMKMAEGAGPAAPILAPMIMALLKFGVTGFKIGRQVEGIIDECADKLKQLAMNPPPPQPNPEMMKIPAQKESDQAQLQHDAAVSQLEHERAVQETQAKMAADQQRAELQARVDQHRITVEAQRDQFKFQAELDYKRWEAELVAKTKIDVAEITAKATLDAAQERAASQAARAN